MSKSEKLQRKKILPYRDADTQLVTIAQLQGIFRRLSNVEKVLVGRDDAVSASKIIEELNSIVNCDKYAIKATITVLKDSDINEDEIKELIEQAVRAHLDCVAYKGFKFAVDKVDMEIFPIKPHDAEEDEEI